jgi:hypothetical protein
MSQHSRVHEGPPGSLREIRRDDLSSLSLLTENCLWSRWLRGTAIINAGRAPISYAARPFPADGSSRRASEARVAVGSGYSRRDFRANAHGQINELK